MYCEIQNHRKKKENKKLQTTGHPYLYGWTGTCCDPEKYVLWGSSNVLSPALSSSFSSSPQTIRCLNSVVGEPD